MSVHRQMPPTNHASGHSEQKSKRQFGSTPSLTSEALPQKTISELFATCKQGSRSREADQVPGASPNKRLKRDHPSTEPEPTLQANKTKRAHEMYTFSTPSTRRTSEVIDLTGESQYAGPLKKKPNGIRPTNTAPRTGPKIIPVLNLKTTTKSNPDEYYHRVCSQLGDALSAIFAGNKLPYSMEELYKGVVIACRQNRAAALNTELCRRCTMHIGSEVKDPILQTAKTSSGLETLDAVVSAWSSWNKQLEVIRSIYYYLDRSFLLHSASLPSIEEMGTTEFRAHIFLATELKQQILQGACDLVSADRRSDQEPRNESLLRKAIQMFHTLTIYSNHFEANLMAESQKYYRTWAEDRVLANDLAGYIEGCGNLIVEELARCDKYGLDDTTKKSLEGYLEDILVDQRQSRILVVEDVGTLLRNDRQDILSQMFSLLQRRRLGEKLKPAFEAFIKKEGLEIVFDEEREQEMVTRLLEFKRKLDQIWEHSFQRHEELGHGLREAFEDFMNKHKRSNMTWGTDNQKTGEMIAKYVDMVLKGGTKAVRASGIGQEAASKVHENEDAEGSSEDEDVEISKQLDQVLDLFRFVEGKAVFEAFYKRDLARRLLLGRSASADSEKSMLMRLKSGKC